MTDSENPALASFLGQKHKHFDLLCRNLGLAAGFQESGNDYAIVSAVAGNVCVFFEHERGVCTFAVGAIEDVKPQCIAQELASRFPRIRALEEHQRLKILPGIRLNPRARGAVVSIGVEGAVELLRVGESKIEADLGSCLH
jgi:hypothetical protein